MPDHILRMGRINFLNVLPIYHPLESGILQHPFELISAPPAILNNMMARGELQVSSCSCIEYAMRPESYYLVSDLSIGSHGPVQSVLLLSRLPIEELEGQEILISGQSHTSVALLKLLLNNHFHASAAFRVGNVSAELSREQKPKAFLAIGDEALRLRNHPDYKICIDLAEAWRQWTNLPFIFGLWVIAANDADNGVFEEDPGELLRKGRDWGLSHMDIILDLTRHGCPLNRQELQDYYYHGLFYNLDQSALKGLKLFYQKLHEAGLLPKIPELRFYTHYK